MNAGFSGQGGGSWDQRGAYGGASLLPPPPPAVPPDLTRATARYKRHAWLAFLGLLGFVTLYVALTGWFCFTSARLFYDLFKGGGDGFADAVGGALCGLLGAFLLGALFFLKSGGKEKDLEVTAQQEPALFEFLNALADRAGAQRPHRVFLSMRVNAAVFYDLSLLNLLFPSRKNLEIGLPLVNCLNLSELTAVLAHEFGHFAQRSMAVGRWVYVAQQIAGQIVASRSWLDKMLSGLSRTDIRIAWIGWSIRLIVWSLRSLLDTAFGLVLLAQRALGREMEFQADLVSVSVTGSDALVHALHRLGAADDAWGKAGSVAGTEAARGRSVPDVFALQSRIVQRMAGILNDPSHGASPMIPPHGGAQFRVFEQEMAEPPRMWSTHPPNRDREDNAKRVYVPSPLDGRSGFCLFASPDALRRGATARFVAELSDEKLTAMSDEAALAAVDKRFERPHLEQRYRGAYMGRSVVLHEKAMNRLYGEELPEAHLSAALQSLYPEQLSHDLRELRQREEERHNLEALHEGRLQAPGGVIRHRGQVIQRRALRSVLAQVTQETDAIQNRVESHDRLCRTSHVLAARALGRGWEPYLFALTGLHHYAAHVEANLEDAQGHLNNVFAIVTADGRISGGERRRLVAACAEVHAALGEIFSRKDQVLLPPLILQRLADALGMEEGGEPPPKTWAEVLPDNYALPPPNEANLADFLRVIDGWTRGALAAIGTLERVSLELMVATEAHVSYAYLNRAYPGDAPPMPVIPQGYCTMARGQERSRQKRLGLWDRFQTADGFFPSAARFAVAGGVLACVLAFGGSIGHPKLSIVNGLSLPVSVEIAGQKVTLASGDHQELTLEQAKGALLVARSERGEQIEAQTVSLEGSQHYVYNVGGGTPLVEWTATYGSAKEVPERRLGAPTFTTADVNHFFEQPPKTVSTKSGSSTRTVLSALFDSSPRRKLSFVDSASERDHMVESHALWDAPGNPQLMQWLALASQKGPALLERRLQRYPTDISALRAQQDALEGPAKSQLCRKTAASSDAAPSDLNLLYLKLRCSESPPHETAKAVLAAYRAHPSHPYLANAAGAELLRSSDFVGAVQAYATASAEPVLADGAGLAQARALRVLGQATSGRLDALARSSGPLASLLALERGVTSDGEAVEGDESAFRALAGGQLAAALGIKFVESATRDTVVRLAGASEGATKPMIQAALEMPGEAASDQALWPSIALAEREGKSHLVLDAQARKLSPDYERVMLPFAKEPFVKGDRGTFERALAALPPEYQSYACVMALVRSGDAAPASCRKLAKGALFASERPYFR
ncbi:MAG: Zn-dependent protease with chaperone function [Myxococcales bacterium]|nr:MAG: Zn-dependent protease with chaperone function [Myxococcales bacterium]